MSDDCSVATSEKTLQNKRPFDEQEVFKTEKNFNEESQNVSLVCLSHTSILLLSLRLLREVHLIYLMR